MRNMQIEIADIAGHLDALRHSLELQMDELRAFQSDLAARVKAVESSVKQLESKKPEPAVAIRPPAAVTPSPDSQAAVPQSPVAESISEEIMLVIAAAVAAYVGKAARIRSARYLQEGLSPWAQQGRVFVQASHNFSHHG